MWDTTHPSSESTDTAQQSRPAANICFTLHHNWKILKKGVLVQSNRTSFEFLSFTDFRSDVKSLLRFQSLPSHQASLPLYLRRFLFLNLIFI